MHVTSFQLLHQLLDPRRNLFAQALAPGDD
jgi:hypothetical protein